MRIVTSCSSRFHIYDQARQLQRFSILEGLIHAYPRYYAERWGISRANLISSPSFGAFQRIVNKLPRGIRDLGMKFFHEKYSRYIARNISNKASAFIGLSSLCKESISYCQQHGIPAIVDHGSLHLRYERDLLRLECEELGLSKHAEIPADWIIDREEGEFYEADKVMVLSNLARKTLIDNGVDESKIFVNHCGVDVSAFSSSVKEINNKFRIIYCGGLTIRKGVRYLVESFNRLKLPNSELVLVGGYSDKQFVRKFVLNTSMNAVKYVGVLDQSALSRIYSSGSIFVMPSIADGFGMVVTQALSSGLPVICTENVGAADIVEHGVTGFIVPSRSTEALESAILGYYTNRDFLEWSSRAASQSIRGQFDWDAYGERLYRFLTNELLRT